MQILDGITDEQKTFWSENGFLTLPGFYSPEQIDRLDAVTDWLWNEKPTSLTVDHNVTIERKRFCDIPGSREGNRLKLNDIYLVSETMRQTILDDRLTPILAGILDDDPVLINTLTIDLGTTQGPHVDSLFMTPQSDDALVATWTALEDVAMDAGPLFYYPGSHRLEPFRFSSGLQHIVHGEFESWNSAIHAGMRERNIDRRLFLAKKGDVFIWHARLVHGGSEITNPTRTRKSLVAHFFTKTDCLYHETPVRRQGNGYWFNRDAQAAPAIGDPVTLPAGREIVETFTRSTRPVMVNVDYVVRQSDGSRTPASEPLALDASDTMLIRGWAIDTERTRVPRRIFAENDDGTLVVARSGLGRHDLVGAFGHPSYAHGGFLAVIAASSLHPGRNTLSIVTEDEAVLHPGSSAPLVVDVTSR